ncbi:MAG: protein kinase [Acidobacteria bacterium]|nr:protein kinase [Acidobacteriota bacterium]
MSLAAGTRLGSFEVLGPLGAGGMGEVYRANDTRLGREVAIKILPEIFAEEEGRLARFEREARLLASINHPGLAAIYGLEQAGPMRYIVMELVPGETLAEQLARGPLAMPDALRLARQIAEALEAAHEKGIVHRDLKPANIKVTPDGKVKVLDLGLAKAMDSKIETGDTSRSPTMLLDQTRPGVILGTAEFMSPEQARGKAVDKRTDIWAFGCVLYEMLTGWRIFQGETISDVLAAILTAEPDWSRLPKQTPPRVRDLLVRCLKKDANERLRDIGDARLELEPGIETASGEVAADKPRRERSRAAIIAVALLALVGIGTWVGFRLLGRSDRTRAPDSKYLVVLPFKDLSGTTQGQLQGDGFVETVSARLNQVAGVQVVTPAASIAASDRQKDPLQVARSLGANLVLRCTIQREASRVRITYSVLNASNGVQLTGGQVTGNSSDLFALQDDLTERVATGLDLAAKTSRTPVPSGLETAAEQERYIEALGLLQRYDQATSVERAIAVLEPLAAQRPTSGLVQSALGRAYLYEYNLKREKSWADKATAAVSRARELAPDLPEVATTTGELFIRTGKPQEAAAAFRRALSRQPNNYDALLGLARAEDSAGNPVVAESTYRRAIALQPNHWAGYNKFGAFYAGRGRYAESAAMFQRVTQLQPEVARGYTNLGGVLDLLGRFDEAKVAYERSIAREPTSGAFSNLGTLQYFLGQYVEAARSFEKAVELTPSNPLLWANLGDAYHWAPGQRTKADGAYARAIQLGNLELVVSPREAGVYSMRARCLAKSGRTREAGLDLKAALGIAPRDPDVMYDAAVVAAVSGERAAAIEWLRRAIDAGYGTAHIAREPEFAELRALPEFQKLIGTPSRRS